MDNYIVSARKYRPSTFRSVVGQRSLTTTLKNAIASGKLAHAYLFCGPRGVGKTSCARIFAKTINCLTPTEDGEACNGCESCQAFNEQRSYNIHELDAASNNSVDDIRSLIEQVRIPPAIGRYKVFIIDEVHMLSSAAFNAFLKTLEEPPHHALFILATTEKHKVLPTILSRCQIYDFSRISITDTVEHLQYIASCEGVTAEPEALNVIAQKADGGMRDALSVFDQVVSFTNGRITYQAVIDNLNVLDYEYYFRLTECMLSGNVRAALLTLNEIINKGFDGHNIITGLASHLRDLLVCRDEATLILFEVGASIRERYKEMAHKCSEAFLFKAIELANECDLNYRVSRNKRLLLELTLIRLCQLNLATQTQNQVPSPASIQPMGNPAPQAPPVASPQQPIQAPVSSSSAGSRVVTTQMPAGAPLQVPATPSAVPPPRKSGRPVSTVIRNLNETKEEKKEETQQETVVQQNAPFTQEQLTGCWDAFSNTIDTKVHLKNIMINCKPQLQENGYFNVSVYNPGQQEELINNSIDILTFLRHHLKNTHIQMQVQISESNEKKLAYTSTEKYEHMMEINPTLARLKEEFNLTLD